MKKSEIFTAVADALHETGCVSFGEDIKYDTNIGDLGLDDLDKAELAMFAGDELDIGIPDALIERFDSLTVEELMHEISILA